MHFIPNAAALILTSCMPALREAPPFTTVHAEANSTVLLAFDPLLLRVTLHNGTAQQVLLANRFGGRYETLWFESRPAGLGEYTRVLPQRFGEECHDPEPETLLPGRSSHAFEVLDPVPSNRIADRAGTFEVRAVVRAAAATHRSPPITLTVRSGGDKAIGISTQHRRLVAKCLDLAAKTPAGDLPAVAQLIAALPECNTRKHLAASYLLSALLRAKSDQDFAAAQALWEGFRENLDGVSSDYYRLMRAKVAYDRGDFTSATQLLQDFPFASSDAVNLQRALDLRKSTPGPKK